MNIKEYIASGILEAYVTGSASEAETHELLYLKEHYPQVQQALEEVEKDLERIAGYMAIDPPPGVWEKIEGRLDEVVTMPGFEQLRTNRRFKNDGYDFSKRDGQFIEVEAESNQIRVHKHWKPVFIAVFILSKIFLVCAIYYYIENRFAQQQINELKTELKLHQAP